MKQVAIIEDQNKPTAAWVQPIGGGAPVKVIVPARAVLGQRIAAMVWPSTSTSHTVLVGADPQRHPETGLEFALYGRICHIGGEIACCR